MAMGWETDYCLPDDVNWSEVLDISYDQGVAAIVLDGYEDYLRKNPSQKSFLPLPENKPLRGKALGRLHKIENNHKSHLDALSALAGILSKKQIPFLIMKGFSCAQYYPIPEHRNCGDIDIYPGRRFAESNDAIKEAGVDVLSHYYRHTTSRIKGILIENHRILCDLRGPRNQTRALEAQLETLGNECLQRKGGEMINNLVIPGAVFPSANFNALFLPWHVSAHLEFERVTIRHLVDWALFLTHDGKDIDVSMFQTAKQNYTYGFSKIADILTNLSMRYLKIPVNDIPFGIIEDAVNFDDRLADRVFEYMFAGKNRERDNNVWVFRINNIKRIWQERWKYKEIYGMGVIKFLFYKVFGAVLNVGENE